MDKVKEKYKILVMSILLFISCFLTYYFHNVNNTNTIYALIYLMNSNRRWAG